MIATVSAMGMTAFLGGCGSTGSSDVTLRLVAADYGDSAGNSSQKYWDSLVKEYEKTHRQNPNPAVRTNKSDERLRSTPREWTRPLVGQRATLSP